MEIYDESGVAVGTSGAPELEEHMASARLRTYRALHPIECERVAPVAEAPKPQGAFQKWMMAEFSAANVEIADLKSSVRET